MSMHWKVVLILGAAYLVGVAIAFLLDRLARRSPLMESCPSCEEPWDDVVCETCGFARHRLERIGERMPRYKLEGDRR